MPVYRGEGIKPILTNLISILSIARWTFCARSRIHFWLYASTLLRVRLESIAEKTKLLFNAQELKQFAVHIIRKFTEVAKRNTKVYIELLFWKGNKEAYEIEEGYGTLTSK